MTKRTLRPYGDDEIGPLCGGTKPLTKLEHAEMNLKFAEYEARMDRQRLLLVWGAIHELLPKDQAEVLQKHCDARLEELKKKHFQ